MGNRVSNRHGCRSAPQYEQLQMVERGMTPFGSNDWASFRRVPSESDGATLDVEATPEPTPRVVGPMTQAPALDQLPNLPSFVFRGADTADAQTRVAHSTRVAMQRGCSIGEIISTNPQDVMTVLKELAVVKLGTMRVSNGEVLRAFGNKTMLTRGSATVNEPDWPEQWREHLHTKSLQSSSFISDWKEMVTLGAYAVNLKDVANRHRGAILQLLLQKYSTGSTSKKVWEFPAVTAIINYHWDHWARSFLLLSFSLFMIWLCSYIFYLILYIEADVGSSILNGPFHNMSVTASFAHLANLLSFLFMCPFAGEVKNILDVAATGFQVFIFFSHLLNRSLDTDWFGYVLVIQCVILFTQVQNYGRALGRSAYFSEVFFAVMYDVRYLLFYLLYSSISAALCLGVLYKNDTKFSSVDEIGHHFESIVKSLVTTFEIVFGNFELGYILEAGNAWAKFVFFFVFQVLMSITVLNLLIAVMTGSYAAVEKDLNMRHNRGRAEVIDKLQVLGIPGIIKKKLMPYVHFLVVEASDEEALMRESGSKSFQHRQEMKQSLQSIGATVQSLREEMTLMSRNHERQIQSLSSKLEVLLNALPQNSPDPLKTLE